MIPRPTAWSTEQPTTEQLRPRISLLL
jgi:hypothetical protein